MSFRSDKQLKSSTDQHEQQQKQCQVPQLKRQPASSSSSAATSSVDDSNSHNNPKMTKSYLLDSEAYLKTNCKSMANTTPNAETPNTRPNTGLRHRAHHHYNLPQLSPVPASDDLLRGINIWSHATRDSVDPIIGVAAGIECGGVIKPLTLHNVPPTSNNFPPVAYINGNSVRPIRCRHYSAQQTAPNMQSTAHVRRSLTRDDSLTTSHISNNNNTTVRSERRSLFDANNDVDNSRMRTSQQPTERRSAGRMMSSEPCKVPTTTSAANQQRQTVSSNITTNRNGFERLSSTGSSDKKIDSNNSHNHHQQHPQRSNNVSATISAPREHQRTSNNNIEQQQHGGDDTGEENNFNVYSLCDEENKKTVIEHLSKRMEGVLRTAKESRRLVCNELLMPQALTAKIAQDVIKLAECEPCGLRGCVLRICIEDAPAAGSGASNSNSANGNGGSPSTPDANVAQLSASRLLGEIALDRTLVPTFEVFLVLKRARTNWLDSLENKLLGRERIVLSEIYLLHKKKLY